jgi:hypothetical protein
LFVNAKITHIDYFVLRKELSVLFKGVTINSKNNLNYKKNNKQKYFCYIRQEATTLTKTAKTSAEGARAVAKKSPLILD